jgi:arsenite methyltransferase
MSQTGERLPEAVERALPLMADPPATPDVSRGYLELLGGQPYESTGPIQSAWVSGVGAALYDRVQSLNRRLFTPTRLPASALRLPPGGRVLDVGCGPGNVTARLGRAVGSEGLALGVDVSEPMLERAVRAEAAGNVGFLRADARDLPFRDATFDAVVSLLVLQLIPEPLTVLGQMTRVLAPGAPLTVLVPTAAGTLFHRLSDLLGNRGRIEFFEPDEVAEALHGHGMASVHTRQSGPFLWAMARKAA